MIAPPQVTGPKPKLIPPQPTTEPYKPPVPKKANGQKWQKGFQGKAQGVEFFLNIKRAKDGGLYARYWASPGNPTGWIMQGILRDDNSFSLTCQENEAALDGILDDKATKITGIFVRGHFKADNLILRLAPIRTAPQAPPASEGGHLNLPTNIENIVQRVTGRSVAVNGKPLTQQEVDAVKAYLRTNTPTIDFSPNAYTFPNAKVAGSVPPDLRKEMFFKIARLAKDLGDPYPELVAAQWYIESGAGTSNAAHTKNNLFGIMKPGGITEGLRTFDNPAESIISRVLIPISNQHHKEYVDYYHSNRLTDSFRAYMERYAPTNIPQATSGDFAYPTSIINVLSEMYGGKDKAYALMERGPYGRTQTDLAVPEQANLSKTIYWPMKKFDKGEATIATRALSQRLTSIRGTAQNVGARVIPSAEFTADSRTSDYAGGVGIHTGWDFNRGSGKDDLGDLIYSIADGTVTFAGTGGLGRQIVIHHPQLDLYSRYGHLSASEVKAGDQVSAGQSIGKLGGSGRRGGKLIENAFPPHLHIEFLKPNKPGGHRTLAEQINFWGGSSVEEVMKNFEDPYNVLVSRGAIYVK